MVDTWGFYLFSSLEQSQAADVDPKMIQQSFNTYMEIWRKCEEWGFDGLAFAEHHFHPLCLAPSPHLIVSVVAGLTKHIRLTTLGTVLPLHDARRFVEECAMLDFITNGRFEPGIAPGAGTVEAKLCGVDAAEVRPRYYSGAELLAKALLGGPITHHDQFTKLTDVHLMPPLQQRAGRSVWVTVMSPESAAWTAKRAYRMCTSWLPTSGVIALAEHYRAVAEAAGHPASPQMLGLRRRVFVADTDAEAKERYEQSVDLILTTAGQAFETVDEKVMARFLEPDDFVIGSPDTVAEKLVSQCEAGGFGVLMALTDFALVGAEALRRSHELIGTRVAPRLKSANVAQVEQPAVAAC